MRSRPVVVLLVLLALLIGCKKRTSVTDRRVEEAVGSKSGAVSGLPDLPRRPATYPDTVGGKVANAIDDGAALAEKLGDWRQPISALEKSLPMEVLAETGSPRGLDASADRAIIDASVERLWRATRKRPELEWEKYVHSHGEVYVEQGLGTYEQGRARGEQLMKKPPTGLIVSPGDLKPEWDLAEVSVANGVRAKWARLGAAWMWGRIHYSEGLEIVMFGPIGVKFSGSVGELDLRSTAPGGHILADLVDLKAGLVLPTSKADPAAPSNTALVRVGTGVASVRYDYRGYRGVLLVRNNPALPVTTQALPPKWPNEPTQATVTLIRY
jgi:hypothetical protein